MEFASVRHTLTNIDKQRIKVESLFANSYARGAKRTNCVAYVVRHSSSTGYQGLDWYKGIGKWLVEGLAKDCTAEPGRARGTELVRCALALPVGRQP